MSCADGRWNPQHLVVGSEIAFIRRGGGLSRNQDDEFEDRRTYIDGNSEPTRVSESQKSLANGAGPGLFLAKSDTRRASRGAQGANDLENTYESAILDPPGQHIP